jgi:hypothetical protein
MTAVFCVNATDRSAETWKQQLNPFTQLEFAVSDAAKGIASAVAQVAAARAGDPTAPPLSQGLDVFHTAYEASRVLALQWQRVEALWDHAADADNKVDRAKKQGTDARGEARAAWHGWQKATAAFEEAERVEAAWKRAHAALDLFRPDGQLNDRAWAETEIAAALAVLTGPQWKKVRYFLGDRRSLAFLDRMATQLAAAEPRDDWREAMTWRWWLRHRRPTSTANPLVTLVENVARQKPLTVEEQSSYDRVAAVLKGTVRASSAVECMNSVLRMQQSRHRRMTQPMLDLKRLYWNCHRLRTGPRKNVCPYEALGLSLPTFDFWELLRSDPTQLAQQLSVSGNT